MCLRYEEKLQEQGLEKEDLSDMVAEHAARQKVRNTWTFYIACHSVMAASLFFHVFTGMSINFGN